MGVIQFGMVCILVSGIVVYCTACSIAVYGHFRRVKTVDDRYTPSVSIIIPARNEEQHIGFLLDDLIRQDYPAGDLQIVVVDDCSEDSTLEIVKRFMTLDKRINLLSTANSLSLYTHKKRAVYEGIMSTGSEIIVTTDADCRVYPGWISGMVKHFTPGVDLVAGAVSVEGGGLLGRFEALEFLGIQAMSSGLMIARFPVTCNGANLAYRRNAFERAGGFDGVGDIVSGDDDLLMQKIAEGDASRIVYAMERAVTVRTDAAGSPSEFLNQRVRWASKIGRYPSVPAIVLLSLIFIFLAVIPVWLLLASLHIVTFTPLLLVYGLKTAGDMLLTGYGVIKNGRPWLMLLFPFADILHVPYILAVTVRGFFGTFEWHGRQTGAVNIEYGNNPHD